MGSRSVAPNIAFYPCCIFDRQKIRKGMLRFKRGEVSSLSLASSHWSTLPRRGGGTGADRPWNSAAKVPIR